MLETSVHLLGPQTKLQLPEPLATTAWLDLPLKFPSPRHTEECEHQASTVLLAPVPPQFVMEEVTVRCTYLVLLVDSVTLAIIVQL